MAISVCFYGVRGSFPCPYADYVKYGGSTACIEIVNDKKDRLIIDAGIGIGRLGKNLTDAGVKNFNLLFTHYHLDHISGLPSFCPFFVSGRRIDIYASRDALAYDLQTAVDRIFSEPLFPVSYKNVKADVVMHNFTGYDGFYIDSFFIKPYPLRHPGGSCGYRISYGNRTVSIVFDTTHDHDNPDPNVLALMRDADMVIYDANFTEAEFATFHVYGHSTWEEGGRLAAMAHAGKYVIFHHNSFRNDAAMDVMAADVRARYPDAVIAIEGMTLTL